MKSLFKFILLFFIFCYSGYSQSLFNLGFEKISQKDSLPDGWIRSRYIDSMIFADSTVYVDGKYSVSIKKVTKNEPFGSIIYKIPNGYTGEYITLEGWIKTENVNDGYAGLILRLDKKGESVEFDNMYNRGVTGTTDWKKYFIRLPFTDSDTIYISGLLVGQGQVWFDDFKISIDGNYIQNLEFKEKIALKAELDHEFDISSKFIVSNLSDREIDNLYKLCKVWGKLKYTNSKIAKGEYNWDYEMFRVLPLINDEKFDSKLIEWKRGYGDVQNIIPKNNYYIDFDKELENPIFKNENPYNQMNFGDDGYRLLSLFRYWNMIEYFFPYKYLIKKNWDLVLKEYIPKIINSKDELSYKLVLLELIGEIQDTHANIYYRQDNVLDNFFGNNIAPLKISFIENKAIVVKIFDEFTKESKVEIGDELVSINGKKVSEYVEENKKYFPSSNYPTKLRNISYKILRTNDSKITLSFFNGKSQFDVTTLTIPFNELDLYTKNIPSHKVVDGDIGYIYPESLQENEINDIMKNFMNKKGIIIDLRCYPNHFYSAIKYFMPKPTPFVKFKTHDLKELDKYNISIPTKIGYDFSDYYKGKIVVLVNEETQSHAEYLTMALQVAPKAKVFGSQTAGADGNVSIIYLPGNIFTMISGIGVYYPDGTETQQIGIKIDEYITPTIKAIKEGQDEVLNKAIDYIIKD